jgi:hypothetical protein
LSRLSFGDWDRTDTLHDKKWCAKAPKLVHSIG